MRAAGAAYPSEPGSGRRTSGERDVFDVDLFLEPPDVEMAGLSQSVPQSLGAVLILFSSWFCFFLLLLFFISVLFSFFLGCFSSSVGMVVCVLVII